jgi:hypothetical protein
MNTDMHGATRVERELHAIAPARSALALALLAATPAFATNLPVLNCADDGSPGTLRSIVAAATSGDIIDLGGLACSTIVLAGGEITTSANDLSFVGPGAAQLAIDGGHASRIFNHAGSGTLSISGLTLENGSHAIDDVPARGGCVYSGGDVTLDHAKVTGCKVSGNTTPAGGGVYAAGELALQTSVLSNNSVVQIGSAAPYPSASGGGAWAHELSATSSSISGNNTIDAAGGQSSGGGAFVVASIYIRYSTIDHNVADNGGGISLLSENTSVISASTISSNSASSLGGGLFGSDLNLFGSVVASNSAGITGGGIFGSSIHGYVSLQDSIAADNTSAIVENADIDGASDDQSTFLAICDNHDIVEHSNLPSITNAIRADPMLGPLADNGGPTLTHALLPGSPALDAASNAHSEGCDQRHLPRLRGTAPDIGSYEDQGDTLFFDAFEDCP